MKDIVLIDYRKRNIPLIGEIFLDFKILEFGSIQRQRYDSHIPSVNKTFICECIRCGFKKEFPSSGDLRKYNRCDCFVYEDGLTLKQRQTAKSRWTFAKSGEKDRGLTWDLSWNEFCEIVTSNCFYCGSEPEEKSITSQKNYTDKCKNSKHEDYKLGMNGIDRVDSLMGYYKFNCVPCCILCNQAKNNLEVSDFYNHILKIAKHKNLI